MPVPSKERVTELISDLVHSQGYDLEDVAVNLAGKHSAVRIMVDSDAGLELDAVARLSHTISEVFDSVPDFGETPYTLEVTSPGIDRPLTHERHWRRARGRKVRIDLPNETVVGRIGRWDDDAVEVVIGSRSGPEVRRVPVSDIEKAIVQVEFSKPDPRELELAGGIPEGRVSPSDSDISEEEEVVEELDK
ncbi:ribosome maturation factor RimP [Rhodococcus oxybenzonivorans]|uniref:Ribosome maturation factor RimP n=1 Tax=Rhodococcus oxybenzonivorans TaxID=1990687 RepID=A0A2S2BX30_9NOCA|nr:ribosome maturation factor RimP [Rhodococcus oxybenzonivorans]AWK73119.1 ribosome maturation factor RimP [Rhodococcus oxybenzonivorans]